jgi:hypothetical protein
LELLRLQMLILFARSILKPKSDIQHGFSGGTRHLETTVPITYLDTKITTADSGVCGAKRKPFHYSRQSLSNDLEVYLKYKQIFY